MVRFGAGGGDGGVVLERAGLHEPNIKEPGRHTRESPKRLITYYEKCVN